MARLRSIGTFGLLILGAIVLRVLIGSMIEYHRGDAASVHHDLDQAMVHYERSLRWYLPGNPYARASLHSMAVVCQRKHGAAQEKGVEAAAQDAYNCYQRTRSAILSTRSLYTPFSKELGELEERMVRASKKLGYPEELMRADLARRHEAHPWWSLLAVLAMAGWIGAAAASLWFGLDPETGRVAWSRRLLFSGAGFAMSFALWLLALFLA